MGTSTRVRRRADGGPSQCRSCDLRRRASGVADRLVVLLDQNVPRAVVGWLQEIRPSWDVHHVTTVGLLGKSDLEVFQWAQSQAAMIITFDEDFADRRSFSIGEHPFLSQER